MEGVSFAKITTNGIHLNVAQAGPADGPLMILLHGFPEFWYGWRKQIPALAAAGFRVWAPDQRGYNTSEKPPRIRDYTLDKLAADIAGLIEAAGQRRASVVGHDWGGAVAWWLASNNPELIDRLVVVNVPHPWVLRRMLLTNPLQTLRSWYMFMFQLPWLPEWMAERDDWRGVMKGLEASSRPGTFTDADFQEYRRAWSQPGACTAMINWYRAMFRYGVPRPANRRILTPTLLLWGVHDKFIRREAADLSLELCDLGRLIFFDTATHWLQHEEADDVNRRIVNFARGV
jgi:epoxide hydrolase 4